MKLNLGCGTDKKEGYVNIDIRTNVKPNLVLDLGKLPYPYKDGEISEIVAKDVLEHFPFIAIEPLLKEWHRLLKVGGTLYIQCPDLEAIMKQCTLNSKYSYARVSYWVYGEQDYPENFHKTGFTIRTLSNLLKKMGFEVTKIQNNAGSNIMCYAVKK